MYKYKTKTYYSDSHRFLFVDPITATAIAIAGATGIVVVGGTAVVLAGGAAVLVCGAAVATVATAAAVAPAVLGTATLAGSTVLLGIGGGLVVKGVAEEASKGAKGIKGFFHKHHKPESDDATRLTDAKPVSEYR